MVVDFKEKKPELLIFAKQCIHIKDGSNLPNQILRRINESLDTIHFTEDDILNVIRNLNPNKVHVHDQISIPLLRICDKAICKPFYLIFSCTESGIFPTEWKMAHVGPIHKRDDKQNVQFQFSEKYLDVLYAMKCTHFLKKKLNISKSIRF